MKEIPLTQGKVALVDDEDFEYLNQWKWCALKKHDGKLYAVRHTSRSRPPRKMIKMHRQILGIYDKNILVDHRNSNGLDNQRQNLRVADSVQNARNRRKSTNKSSRYMGVTRCKRDGNWRVTIQTGSKTIQLGRFDCEIEAARAYNSAGYDRDPEFFVWNDIYPEYD
jgi:hypothetical protein